MIEMEKVRDVLYFAVQKGFCDFQMVIFQISPRSLRIIWPFNPSFSKNNLFVCTTAVNETLKKY